MRIVSLETTVFGKLSKYPRPENVKVDKNEVVSQFEFNEGVREFNAEGVREFNAEGVR